MVRSVDRRDVLHRRRTPMLSMSTSSPGGRFHDRDDPLSGQRARTWRVGARKLYAAFDEPAAKAADRLPAEPRVRRDNGRQRRAGTVIRSNALGAVVRPPPTGCGGTASQSSSTPTTGRGPRSRTTGTRGWFTTRKRGVPAHTKGGHARSRETPAYPPARCARTATSDTSPPGCSPVLFTGPLSPPWSWNPSPWARHVPGVSGVGRRWVAMNPASRCTS